MIERSLRLLVLEAVASNQQYYSEPYIRTMERQSPVRFDFLGMAKRRLQKGRGYPTIRDAAALSER